MMTDEQLQSLFAGMERHLDKRADAIELHVAAKIDAKISDLETRIDAKLEKLETTLLAEFHKWASPTDARLRTHSAALRAIDLEMEALSDRMAKLEGEKPAH